MKKKRISIWLVPSKNDSVYLSRIINDLAREYGACQFLPHLTLYAGLNMEEVKAKEVIKKAIKDIDIKPFVVKVEKINYSSVFTKTLYLEIEKNKPLNKIYSVLKKHLKSHSDYFFDPHISLIYKNNMPETEKIKVVEKLKLRKTILMGRIVVISAEKSISIEEDVKDWKPILRRRIA